MHLLIYQLTALLFFIWILPLGIFIKPSFEKFACDGQRAICLCSHVKSVSAQGHAIEGFGLKANDSGNKESNASVGSFYLAQYFPLPHLTNLVVLITTAKIIYQDPLITSIEHIPKA